MGNLALVEIEKTFIFIFHLTKSFHLTNSNKTITNKRHNNLTLIVKKYIYTMYKVLTFMYQYSGVK